MDQAKVAFGKRWSERRAIFGSGEDGWGLPRSGLLEQKHSPDAKRSVHFSGSTGRAGDAGRYARQ